MAEVPDYLKRSQEQEARKKEKQRKLQEDPAERERVAAEAQRQAFAQHLADEKRRQEREAEAAADKAHEEALAERRRQEIAARPQPHTPPQNPRPQSGAFNGQGNVQRGGAGQRGGYGDGGGRQQQANQKPGVFFLKDLAAKENSNHSRSMDQANKDRKKLKKALLPLLTLVNENDAADKAKWKDDALLVLKKRYDDFSLEDKKIFTGLEIVPFFPETIARTGNNESKVLTEKFDKIYNEALVFVNDFRNFAMHKKLGDPFGSFSFDKMDGALFGFLRLCALRKRNSVEKEKDTAKEANLLNKEPYHVQVEDFSKYEKQREYWDKILGQTPQMMKANKGEIPFVYALTALALFIEAKEMQEILTLARLGNYGSSLVRDFSLRGGFKSIAPGVFQEDKSLELHRLQIQRREKLQQKTEATHKRVVEEYKNFVGADEFQKKPENNYGLYYQKLLRYHGFSNSYPEIPEFERDIKVILSEELSQARKERIENIKKDNEAGTAPRKEIPNLETNPEVIIKGLTKIFRRGDTFLREAMAFLEDHNPGWFKENWRIVGNTVLYYKDYTPIEFDLRRKTRPSLNAASSVYKLRYNAKTEGKIISMGRKNLQALLVSVLLGNEVDFGRLWKTASAPVENPQKPAPDNKALWQTLAEKCKEWNRYKQAQLVLKYFRKFMKRMHVNDSITFHQKMMQTLYLLDTEPSEVKTQLRVFFTQQGSVCPPEVEAVLRASTLLGLCQKCCLAFGELPPKQGGGNKTHKPIYTWPAFALHPRKRQDPKIKEALGWKDEQSLPLFDLLMKHAEAKNYSLPKIIDLYAKKHSDRCQWPDISKKIKGADLRRENEIRSLLVEEFLFQEMAFHYAQKILKNKTYMELVSTQKEGSKRSPTAFKILWNLSPKIELSLEDYSKKDVKTALNWILSPARIKEKGEKLSLSDQEIAQRCLTAVLEAHRGISRHPTLKTKAPKYMHYSDDPTKTLSADAVKNLLKRVIWLQKEMLYFTCDIERQMIYNLSEGNALPEEAEDKGNKLGFFEFSQLIIKMQDLDPKRYSLAVLGPLIAVRNMLAHGRLHSPRNQEKGYAEIQFSSVPDIIDKGLKALGRKTLAEIYANARGR